MTHTYYGDEIIGFQRSGPKSFRVVLRSKRGAISTSHLATTDSEKLSDLLESALAGYGIERFTGRTVESMIWNSK